MFVADEVLTTCFARLRSIDVEGKSGKERTSALMYFLAFELLNEEADGGNGNAVDLDPRTPRGKLNRERMTSHFMRLVTVSAQPLRQIVQLGEIDVESTAPEKRISANFLTVPVKKASDAAKPLEYPRRPAPLLLLGIKCGAGRWGAKRHEEWEVNLAAFLADTQSKTPFIDSAVLLLRDFDFGDRSELDAHALIDALKRRFGAAIGDAWGKHMRLEWRRSKQSTLATQAGSSNVLAKWKHSAESPRPTRRVSEKAHIDYLEGLLVKHGIPFEAQRV